MSCSCCDSLWQWCWRTKYVIWHEYVHGTMWVPVTVEHTAVSASGQQAGGGWWRGAGPGCGRSLQEGVCVYSLEGDLLETVCLCLRRGGETRVSMWNRSERHSLHTGQDAVRSPLTDAVFWQRDVPLWRSKVLLSLRAAAVACLRHWAAGQQFEERGTPVLQSPIYCQNKHVKHICYWDQRQNEKMKENKTHIFASAGVLSLGWWREGGEFWMWSSYAVCSPVVSHTAAPRNWGQAGDLCQSKDESKNDELWFSVQN